MRRGIRYRLSVYQVATLSVAMVAVAAIVESSVREYYTARLDQHLVRQAALVRRIVVDPLSERAPTARLVRIVKTLAEETEARITVLAPDGSVLADSLSEPPPFANLSFRPEIAAVLSAERRAAAHHARAIRADGMHVAVAVHKRGAFVGVVRVSLSLADLRAQLRELRLLIMGTVLLTTMAAVVATLAVTRSLIRPVQEVTEAARKMAGGDLTPRVVANPDDEIGQLTRSFNTMAERIQAMMAELDGEREKMARVFAQMADGVTVTDSETRVVLMNPAAERLLGTLAKDALGRPLDEAIPIPGLARICSQTLHTGQELTTEISREDGEEQVLGVFAAPVIDRPGAPPGVMLVLHDLTEAQRTERVRREFVANASHELRTPIAAIKIMVESLLDGAQEDPPTRARFLHLVDREADRLTHLVTDLLDLSQMDSGQWPLEPEDFPLREVVDGVVAKFALVAADRHQRMTGRCPDGVRVRADPRAVNQILGNLVSNAIRYTPDGGEIQIHVEADEGFARIRVRDTGIGVPEEARERIFERFYRVDKARSRELGGTGLGLAIVKYLVEALSGAVSLESTPGAGSTFTVTLPLSPDGNGSREEPTPRC